MATGGEGGAAASSSIPSIIKAYDVPYFLLAVSIFYQFVVLPRSFPLSHYDVKNRFEVESAPAIVFLKDPSVKPIVFRGSFNSLWFSDIIEENKQRELPQLRSTTSMELGCDARGYSLAGFDTSSWYCVILAGRLGPELNKMCHTMRRVGELLSSDGELDSVDKDKSLLLATALKNK